jgi:raffinose/stachyose/melibiose transport system substrate-binding protein
MSMTRTGRHFARFAKASVFALSALALAGLAGSAAAETIKLKQWVLKTQGYPEFLKFAAAEFKKTHPDVDIVVEDFPNEAYKTTIQVALVGSDPPDVFFNWSGEDAARLARDGLVLDLTDKGKDAGGFQKELSPGWVQSFKFDGKIWGLPTDAVSKYFYYNKTFFAKNNLKPAADFDELLGLCKAVRKIDPNMVPLPLGNSERWKLNHYITMFNERVMGADATAADYDLTRPADQLFKDPGYVAAWQKVLDMKNAGCFQDAPNATSPEASRAMFSSEQSPMIYCGTWCAGIFDADGFTDYAMFRMPGVKGGKGDVKANFLVPEGYMISSKTKYPKEAIEWASFVVSDEMGKKFAELLKMIPSNSNKVAELTGATEQFKWIAQDVGSFSKGISVLDVLLENSVSEAYLNDGVEILNGTKTPEQAMEHIRGVALEAKKKLGR